MKNSRNTDKPQYPGRDETPKLEQKETEIAELRHRLEILEPLLTRKP